MPTIVKMPQLGESVAEGTIGRWLKQPGDRVERDEPLVEIQTDKVNAEVSSPVAGTVQTLLQPEGTTVAVQADIAVIDDGSGASASPASPPTPYGAQEVKQPRSGGSVRDAATEPTAHKRPAFTYDSSSKSGGVVSSARDDDAPATDAPATLSPTGAQAPATPANAARRASSSLMSANGAHEGTGSGGEKRFYTPVVLRIAQEHGLNLEQIQGSGLGGRVTRKDVERALAEGSATSEGAPATPSGAPTAASSATTSAAPTGSPSRVADSPLLGSPSSTIDEPSPPLAGAPDTLDEVRGLTPMRHSIAQHLAKARAEIPDAWSLTEIDVTPLVRYRESQLAEWQAREGWELTFMPFFVRAVLAGLREVPEMNASWNGDSIVLHRQYHLGIAVSVEQGLVVPVLRDADQYNVAGLARALWALVQKARSGKLVLGDLQGATFTVNNPGSLGSIMSQPIVPLGQAAIVTMEAIVKRLVVLHDDSIAIRSMMNACLSFDHRILDGSHALRFLHTLKRELERPDHALY